MEETLTKISLEKLEGLLRELNFRIEKKFYEIKEKPKDYNEHFRWGVKMTLCSMTDEYVNDNGILETAIGQLSPDFCLAKLAEKIFLGVSFEAFYRESKCKYHFTYENEKLKIEPI